MKPFFQRVYKFLASVKLAVFVLVGLAIVSAAGTIVESRFDAEAAQAWVYRSPYMYVVMAFLAINLTFAMIVRFPWKERHIPFLLAHFGILILIGGAWLTQIYGLDGTMAFGIGESSREVTIPSKEVVVYRTRPEGGFERLFAEPVEFLTRDLTKRPMAIQLPGTEVRFTDFLPYAFRETKIVEDKSGRGGPAIRFQLQNDRVSQGDWMSQETESQPGIFDLGPARVVLAAPGYQSNGRNEIVLSARDGDSFSFEIYSRKESGAVKRGLIRAGDSVETPWMGFAFRLLKSYRHSEVESTFKKLDRPTPVTTSAVKMEYQGASTWLGLDSMARIFTDRDAFVVTYSLQRVALDFPLKLLKFEVGRYQGSMMAASYQSQVQLETGEQVLISMNEPLKTHGLTFYQASFQENERGEPTVSVLSVNRDPGRFWKYLGSLLLVAGIIHLFYRKNQQRQARAILEAQS